MPTWYGNTAVTTAHHQYRISHAAGSSGAADPCRHLCPALLARGIADFLAGGDALGHADLASDIPANRETGLDDGCYFAVGDTDTLALKLRELAVSTPAERARISQRLRAACMRYNWDDIAESTMQVMKRAAGRSAPVPLQGSNPRPAQPH